MDNNNISNISLPDEAKAVIWRIFGAGTSHLKKKSTYALIECVINKYVNPAEQKQVITEIRSWFESRGDQQWLKSDMRELVAILILEGVRAKREETAIWAVSWIDANQAVPLIHALWSLKEIDSFVEAAIKTLKKLCDQDEVLDATRLGNSVQDSISSKIPKNAVVREGRLETFRNLDMHGVHRGLYSEVGNLIELVIELRPEQFETLIEKLDHPVVQVRAVGHIIDMAFPLNHRMTLEWITKDSCDALVALAIVHTLNTVDKLDNDLQYADRMTADQYGWSTELRHPQDDLDSAAFALINDLVDRLTVLNPLACARWIGEMLSEAPHMLHPHGGREKPLRIEQLEEAYTKLLARLVCQSWSDNLFTEICAGLRLTPRMTWTRHLAEVAWEIRDDEPARAAEIARLTLYEHERHIAKQLEQNRLFLNWNDWHDREWISGLGTALVLSHEELDLPEWVSAQCRALPLSVWDAEENLESFIVADRVAQLYFLVSFHAIVALKRLGRTIDPVSVCTLAETLWEHCHFAGQHHTNRSETSVSLELAARYAAEFGEPSDAWLLDQARHPGLGPLALWALLDQRKLKVTREGGTDLHYDEMIITELTRIVTDRFGDGGQFGLEELRFWGQLWLLLSVINEAEQTAMAISAFPLRKHDRIYKILILKLFALVASKRKLAPEIEGYIASLYGQLWPGYTPKEEIEDRKQIDELLKLSETPIL